MALEGDGVEIGSGHIEVSFDVDKSHLERAGSSAGKGFGDNFAKNAEKSLNANLKRASSSGFSGLDKQMSLAGHRFGMSFGDGVRRGSAASLSRASGSIKDFMTNQANTISRDETLRRAVEKKWRESLNVKVDVDKNRNLLNQFSAAGTTSAGNFLKAFLVAIPGRFAELALNPVGATILSGLLPIFTAAGLTLGTALGGAIIAGVGLVGLGTGIAFVFSRDASLKEAGVQLGQQVVKGFQDASAVFAVPVRQAMKDLGTIFQQVMPSIRATFNTLAPLVDDLVAGIGGFVRAVGPALARAAEMSRPFIQELAKWLPQLGVTVGQFFDRLKQDLPELKSAFVFTLHLVEALITSAGALIHVFAVNFGILRDGFAGFLEGIAGLGMLFKDMPKAVVAFLGPAASAMVEFGEKANDMAINIRKSGDTSVDAANDFRNYTSSLFAGAGASITAADAQKLLEDRQKASADVATQLKKNYDLLYGAQIAQMDASEGQARAFFALQEQLKTNKDGINKWTQASLANRDALINAAKSVTALTLAEIANGVPMDLATQRHKDRVAILQKEAQKAGLNKAETDKLIKTYAAVPASVTTQMNIKGAEAIYQELLNMKAAQMALQQGVPIDQAAKEVGKQRQAAKKGNFVGAGGLATGGGVYGAGTGTSDSVPKWLSAGEHVWTADEVRKAGGQTAMYGIREMVRRGHHIWGDAEGLAAGGQVRSIKQPSGIKQSATNGAQGRQTWPFPVGTQGIAKKNKDIYAAWKKQWEAMQAVGDFTDVGTESIGKIISLARSFGIPFSVTSAKRSAPQPGMGWDYHMTGNAVDFVSPNMTGLAAAFMKFAPRLLELIHSGGPGFFVKNGRKVGPYAQAQHYDHVHVAATLKSLAGGGAMGGYSGATNIGGVGQWSGVVTSVLRELGVYSPGNLGAVLASIQQESGGNPNAVQHGYTDVNTISGDLAKGLNQVIGATFRSNAGKYVSRGQFDPYANIYASVRYAMRRYGPRWASVMAAPGGYDNGGILPPGGVGMNYTRAPEAVFTHKQFRDVLEENGGDDSIEVNVYGVDATVEVKKNNKRVINGLRSGRGR